MSGKLPALTGAEVIRALERVEFVVLRIRGSHHFLRHPDGRTTVVSMHVGDTGRLLSRRQGLQVLRPRAAKREVCSGLPETLAVRPEDSLRV